MIKLFWIQNNSIEQTLLYLKYSKLLIFIFIHSPFKIPVTQMAYKNDLINMIKLVSSISTTYSIDFFPVFYLCPPLTKFQIKLVRKHLFGTPVKQPWMRLDVKSYSSWCYSWWEFSVLAKKNRLALTIHS